MDTVTTLPRGPIRVEDLDSFPDDGHRYELVDGTLIVSPAPALRHQLVLSTMFQLLAASCPSNRRVLTAPADVVLADDTVVQPDLLVARREDLEGAKLTTPWHHHRAHDTTYDASRMSNGDVRFSRRT